MDQDLIDLISACKGEDVGQSRREPLLERLRQDWEFQQAFVDEIRMLGMLKAVQSLEPRWLRLQDELGWSLDSPFAEKDREAVSMRKPRGVPPGRGIRPERWKWRAAALVAAVGLCLIAVTTGYLRSPRHRREATSAVAVVTPPYPQIDVEVGIAMVVDLHEVRWERADEPHPSVGDLLAPGRLRLRSGRATISMLNGAVLIVEGPADLDLFSIDRIFCREGKLRTRVPKGAEGLVVSSPGASVLDLGTEFGLNVEAGGKSSVKVFEGKVEAMMRTGSGNQNISRYFNADHTFELDPKTDAIKDTDSAGSEGFVAPLDLPVPPLSLDPSYPDAILASDPWSYWRFEASSSEGDSVPNTLAGRPSLRVVGPVRFRSESENNHYAEFPARESAQYLAMDGLWEPPSRPGYAVELWFLPRGIDHSSLISMPAPSDTNFHFFFMETGSRNRHAMHPPATVRLLDRWPPAIGGGYNIYSKRTYTPYRWHHLVGQMNAGRMELYLDGEPTYSLRTDLDHPTIPCQVLLGRLSTLPIREGDNSRWFHGRPFVGLLDEVALYSHPLSLKEIQNHRRLAGK